MELNSKTVQFIVLKILVYNPIIKEGHHVIGMDNFITGDKRNISHLLNHPNFEFIKHDVTEFVKIDGELDYILHFALPASPIYFLMR